MAGENKAEKTFPQKLGTALGYVLLLAIFLMILPTLVDWIMNGVSGVIGAIGNGAQNAGNALHNAHIRILNFNQKGLQVLFSIVMVIALGFFLVFLLKKIIDQIKKWGEK